jgi:hypothetical protein
MREHEQHLEPGRDPEATVIKPLFDEDATEVARPVIPLDDREVAEGVGAYVGTGTAPPVYTRAWKRRNKSTALLVIAALFAGTVAGIAGLYLYQRSRTSDSTAAAAGRTSAPEQTAPAATEAPQATTTTTAPQPTTSSAPSTTEAAAPADAVGEVAAGAVEAEKSTVKVNDGDGAAREAERATARRAPDVDEGEEAAAAPVKRGRKGDEDEAEPVEPSRSRRQPVYDTQGEAPEGSAAARRAAREEDRLRRMRRERRRGRGEAYMVDSIRGIFEGGRQSPPR